MTKAHILQEIKRTAADNGGMPLGSRRFETATGIRESEWIGKLWARWSDALREAGFAPNQLQVAYDRAALLEMYAELAQELARLPTANDLRFKDYREKSFPNQKVFFNRFGTKAELVRQLDEYCRSHSGYEDVARLCEAYVPRNQGLPDESKPPEVEIGFVYLTKSGRFYKIGKTNAAGRRARELALQLPEKATTVHVIRTDDPTGIEAYWHKRFEAKWKNGEWFDLNAVDVSAFKRRKFM
jgi:Meiotically Up-regulated Gene 113 (MUG113) protein